MASEDLWLECCDCHRLFMRNSRKGPVPKRCEACRQQHHSRQNAVSAATRETPDLIRCGRCRKELPQREFYPAARKPGGWCKKCRREHYAESVGGIVEKQCESCGKTMRMTARMAGRKRFCSPRCKQAKTNARLARERLEQKPQRSCEWCGKPIAPEKYASAVYCSRRCSHAAKMARNPHLRLADRAKSFGITPEEYVRLKASPCDICGTHDSQDGRALNIDHCHTTGTVRGTLCANCNKMLGLVGDDPERLRAAARYLERSTHGTRNA